MKSRRDLSVSYIKTLPPSCLSHFLGGRSIVFTDTKADANDLAVTLSDGG